jgi:dihydrofolate reductase
MVVWHVVMSLDGFIAAADDQMGWIFDYVGPNETADELVHTTGALVVGRRTYEVEDRDRPGFYGGRFTGPVFVLTHQAPAERPDWFTGTYVPAGIEDAVSKAQQAAGERNVVLLGASMARQALEAGLLDEILVHVAPVLLGGGIRLFDRPGGERVRLEKVFVREAGPLTDLRFRVRK